MTAQQAIKWIESARYTAVKVGLDNTRKLLAGLGNPERAFKSVHVAGTNGKGSVCAVVESVLRQAGYRTGLYTSPYLMRYNERICINGVPIDDELLVKCADEVGYVSRQLEKRQVKPSAFELGTAVAFCAFKHVGVEAAVVETGLGGRLDPTNVISPEVTAITAIGMDHTQVLGNTLELIAREKAGILKPRTPGAIYPAPEGVANVFKDVARGLEAPLYFADDYGFADFACDRRGSRFAVELPVFGLTRVDLRLAGAHQAQNARLAMLTLSLMAREGFNITTDCVCRGVAEARWPGRLEWFGDDVLLDGAHNPDGARALAKYMDEFLVGERVTLLTGMMSDKQPLEYAKIIAPYVKNVVATSVDWNRALPSGELAGIYASLGVRTVAVDGIAKALEKAVSLKDGGILLVAGSLYLVGAVRRLLTGLDVLV